LYHAFSFFLMGSMMGRKAASELKALAVGRIAEPGLHFVGVVPGLALNVTASGARSWILRAMVGGKRRDMGLGGYPAVTLADAHRLARDAREKISFGADPIAERLAARSELAAARVRDKTFSECAALFLAGRADGWRNAKHRAQWESTLATYAAPHMGTLLVRDVDTPHVMAALRPIWTTKTETAARVRGRIEAVLDWATVQKLRSGDNPARWKGHLEHLLPAPAKVATVAHHTALPIDDVPPFMSALRAMPGTAARALEFAVLTAARSGEVRGATWAEIDFVNSTWRIEAARMKAGKPHEVPLSAGALEVLKSFSRGADSEIIFTGQQGRPLSDMALTAVMRRMKIDAVPHGFRSSFRDWAAERTDAPRQVMEHALAHKLPDPTEAAYARSTLFKRRAALMQQWDEFCSGAAGIH
jgi:integrase